jgi:hypothetical protein
MSPVMAGMPMPASVMSPDEMLRAYAERRRTGTPAGVSTSPIGFPRSPPPTTPMSPNNTGGNMRSLTGMVSPNNTGSAAGHGKKSSVAVGQYGGARYAIGDDEDAYGGMH